MLADKKRHTTGGGQVGHDLVTSAICKSQLQFQQTTPVTGRVAGQKFPKDSRVDGRWVYYKDQADIQPLVKPRLSAIIPEYAFYTVTLTNYLGYHINPSRNLILYDSAKSTIIHVVPIWYSDISEDLLRLFIGKTFPDSTSLLAFTLELQSLMNAGSTGAFENTVWHKDKVAFDLTYQGANRKEVWRHIEMFIEGNKIRRFRSTNPKMNEWVTVE